jgi:hypothetical protein
VRLTKSPGAVAALGASGIDQHGGKVFSETNRQHQFTQAPIRAELVGSNSCEADGLIGRGYAPALDLCRQLVAAGYDPARPLEAYRGDMLCLRVRSIGEGANLEIIGFRQRRKPDAASPVAPNVSGAS